MKSQKNVHSLGEVNLKITFNIFFFSVVVSTLTTTAYAIIPKTHRDTLTFAVTTFAMSAGSLSAFYAYKGLRENTNSQIIDRTLPLIQQWNDPQYTLLRESAKRLLDQIRKQPPNQQDKFLMDYFEDHPDQMQPIITILNHLTQIAIYIELDLVNELLLKKYYQVIVQDYCESFHVFINQRNRHDKEIYRALIELSQKWKR